MKARWSVGDIAAEVDVAIVAVAGPLMNFAVALICFAVLRHVEVSSQTFEVLRQAWIVNVVLGIFNLIPVPPLELPELVVERLLAHPETLREL